MLLLTNEVRVIDTQFCVFVLENNLLFSVVDHRPSPIKTACNDSATAQQISYARTNRTAITKNVTKVSTCGPASSDQIFYNCSREHWRLLHEACLPGYQDESRAQDYFFNLIPVHKLTMAALWRHIVDTYTVTKFCTLVSVPTALVWWWESMAPCHQNLRGAYQACSSWNMSRSSPLHVQCPWEASAVCGGFRDRHGQLFPGWSKTSRFSQRNSTIHKYQATQKHARPGCLSNWWQCNFRSSLSLTKFFSLSCGYRPHCGCQKNPCANAWFTDQAVHPALGIFKTFNRHIQSKAQHIHALHSTVSPHFWSVLHRSGLTESDATGVYPVQRYSQFPVAWKNAPGSQGRSSTVKWSSRS